MKALVLLLSLFTLISTKAQSTWDVEREKEHGVLRIKIDDLKGDGHYYFVYKNKNTQNSDTLRNQEAHLDLGNSEPNYHYKMGKLLKGLPPGVYSKKSINEHLYDDFNYVSFPILGLSEAQIIVKNSNNSQIMRIFLDFNSHDTADYIFQLNFKKGDFYINAPLLKHHALSKNYPLRRSSIEPEQLLLTPYKYIKRLSVKPSQTSNFNLSIVNIGDPEALRCTPFYDKLRYSSPIVSAIKTIEHPFYKKIKYLSPTARMRVPNYMKADPSNDQQKAYCLEHSYVKPLYLYREKTKKGAHLSIGRNNLPVNRKFRRSVSDSTFLGLESYLETLLFSKNNPCDQPFYSVSKVDFPLIADSIVSIEISERFYNLPPADSVQLMDYKKNLKKAVEKAERPAKKNFFRFFKRKKKIRVDKRPYMRTVEVFTLPMPEYEVDIPKSHDSILYSQPSYNNLNNGYYSWEAVEPFYNFDDTNIYSIQYFSVVLNPYTLQPFDPEELFGPNYREVVYSEIMKEYERLHSSGENLNFNFNDKHYKPELKRNLNWGIDQENVIIYYGNEGEFWTYRKLLIPFEHFE